jgi:hypothetical protein
MLLSHHIPEKLGPPRAVQRFMSHDFLSVSVSGSGSSKQPDPAVIRFNIISQETPLLPESIRQWPVSPYAKEDRLIPMAAGLPF